MKTERELFEEWCHIDDEFCTHRYTDNCQEYSDDYTQSAWLAWQSSVQRDGYKLVPCEPTKEMLIAADNCVIDGKVTSHNIYKAMIGVAP